MTTIYERARAMAVRQLAPLDAGGKGAPLTLQQIAPAVYVPGGAITPGAVTNYQGSGIRTWYNSRDIDGVLVQANDVKLIVSPVLLNGASMPNPAIDDVVIFDGVSYTVQGVKPWNYAGITCGFVVQGRQ